MRHVSPRLADLTDHARSLTSTGDLAGAREVLADALAPADADPLRASPELADAAALHARVLVTLGDPAGAHVWAGFAQAAQARLHGPHDERTIAATATHAAVLHRVGNHSRAARLYADIVDELSAADGPSSARVLAAEADLATAEHAGGHCATARRRLAGAWRRHRAAYGDAAPAGIKMLARLGAMERECGYDVPAHDHLTLAQELCARYLPGDHSLTIQVASLSRASRTGRHACGHGAGASPTAPGVTGVAQQPPAPPAVTPPAPRPRPAPPTGPRAPTGPASPNGPGGPVARGFSDSLAPGMVSPAPVAPGAGLSGYRWPVEAPEPAGAYLADGGYTGDPLFRPDSERLLPVHVPRPALVTSRRPVIVAGVVTIGLVVVAAVTAAAMSRHDRRPAAPGTAPSGSDQLSPLAPRHAAAPTATAAPGPTPTGLSLDEAAEHVTVRWRYPAGAQGPVIVSGGRAGQQRHALQTLPAGSTEYAVYQLDADTDYCFTVSVVYSVDDVAVSEPACTARGG